MTIHGKYFNSTKLVKSIDSQPLQVKYNKLFAEDISEGSYPLEIFIAVLSFEIHHSYKEKVFFINDKDSIFVVFANTTKKTIVLNKENETLLSKNIDRLVLGISYKPYTINFEHESMSNITKEQLNMAISELPRIQDKRKDNSNNIMMGISIVGIFTINSLLIAPYIKGIAQNDTAAITTLETKKNDITIKLSVVSKKLSLIKARNITLDYKTTLNYADKYKKYSIKNSKLPKSFTIKEGVIIFNG